MSMASLRTADLFGGDGGCWRAMSSSWRAHQSGTGIRHVVSDPTKRKPEAHGRRCGRSTSHESPCCATAHTPLTGRICVLPQRLIYPSRGRGNKTHSRPASLTASCVFSQGYGSVSQPGGRAYQPPARAVGHHGHRHVDHGQHQTIGELGVARCPLYGTERIFRCPSGVCPGLLCA